MNDSNMKYVELSSLMQHDKNDRTVIVRKRFQMNWIARFGLQVLLLILQVQISVSFVPSILRYRALTSCQSSRESTCTRAQTFTDEGVAYVVREIQNVLKNKSGVVREGQSLAKGRFLDFVTTEESEKLLENMFIPPKEDVYSTEDIENGISAMQSLLVLGLQTGLKGPPQYLDGLVSHLRQLGIKESGDEIFDIGTESRRLKFERDSFAGIEILSGLVRKRTAQGAFELLVSIGVWSRHEDLSLLRSGLPVRFTDLEKKVAKESLENTVDYDGILGVRKDLTSMKVYTIDNESTREIDDGISVEVIEDKLGSKRHRFWIHISDADRWAPRYSNLFKVGERRSTSIYAPTKTYPMFPDSAFDVMSLNAGRDRCALSLGVELLPNGEIDLSSIVIHPSIIRVDFRLTYDDADEMFDEGVAFNEEWELGVLLEAAKLRRAYRCSKGSVESLVGVQIPKGTVSIKQDSSSEDGISVSIEMETSHNAGLNNTMVADFRSDSSLGMGSVSPSNLLVTEMMILSGEAMGKWAIEESKSEEIMLFTPNQNPLKLKVPFRAQKAPAFRTREQEYNRFLSLLEDNRGGGYCAAWYVRRFYESVTISEDKPHPHAGLGIDCYVQWSSPIRRFTDLQVHSAVKRYIRAKAINQLVWNQKPIPDKVNLSQAVGLDDKINYKVGLTQMALSRKIQRESERRWMYEYLRRKICHDKSLSFEGIVLGCIESQRKLYIIYLPEIGLEVRYASQLGDLSAGEKLRFKCQNINPQMSLITWTVAL